SLPVCRHTRTRTHRCRLSRPFCSSIPPGCSEIQEPRRKFLASCDRTVEVTVCRPAGCWPSAVPRPDRPAVLEIDFDQLLARRNACGDLLGDGIDHDPAVGIDV